MIESDIAGFEAGRVAGAGLAQEPRADDDSEIDEKQGSAAERAEARAVAAEGDDADGCGGRDGGDRQKWGVRR